MLAGTAKTGETSLVTRAFAAFDHHLQSTRSPVLVGLSGGPDSSALLALLARWCQARHRPPPQALIVDHGLRIDSEEEARRVIQRWHGYLGSQVAGLRLSELARRSQAAAREARYRALSDHARTIGARAIVTGHHADDQIETLLERLSRGSGIAGLAGLSARRALYPVPGAPHVVRPLLFARKAELIDWLEQQALDYEQDPSNAKPQYARARWRYLLSALAGQGISDEALLSLADASRAMRLRQGVRHAAILREHASWQGDWTICLAVGAVEGLEPASQHALLAGLTQIVGWCDYPSFLGLPTEGGGVTGNRCILRRQRGWLWIVRDPRCFSDLAAGPWRPSDDLAEAALGLSAAACSPKAASRSIEGGVEAAGKLDVEFWPQALKALNLPHSVAKFAPLWRNSRGDWQLATKSVLTLAPNFQTVDQSYRLVTSAMQLRFSSNLEAGSGASG